ncbi:protein SRC2-like [Tasmannia lanceolata]|uniref:protein SRC2-like n=1 Tax=Tasmannia lanceolata TaxID=3420 RepID=UPI0040631B79
MSLTSDFRPRKKHGEHLREMEVLIISAQDLKNVKHVTKMRAYAVVYVEHGHVAKTHVDEEGGVNPVWNEKLTVKFPAKLPENDVMAALNIDIYAHGHVREKPVGSARVLLCDVLKGGDASEPVDNPIQCMTIQVRRPSGRPQGFLNLWVPPTGKFMESRDSLKFNVKDEAEEETEAEVEVEPVMDVAVAVAVGERG